MDIVLKQLDANAPLALLLLSTLVLILVVISASLAVRIRRLNARWKQLLDGAKGDNLERLLYDHLRERMQIQAQIDAVAARTETLEDKMNGAKRHIGLVRYDAFEDVGGSQSFALAIYDDLGNGALVTSLIGRSDCRVYAKPLFGGKSERNLSQEEQRAVREAVDSGPKSIVSH